MIDAWYPDSRDYYVGGPEMPEYPERQGDLFALGASDDPDALVQLIHPTCELAKPKVTEVQVIEVRPLGSVSDPSMAAGITTGWKEIDGRIQIMYANTFFLPPPRDASSDALFSDFRRVRLAPKSEVLGNRVAALTHDARVAFIRRELYFRYRLMFSTVVVRQWQAEAIRNDPFFRGPRPNWPELLGAPHAD